MKKIVGIDIGGSSVKLAYFAGSTLKKAAMAPLPDNMVADGRILSMDAMADFLRQAARDNGIPLTNAAVVLPSTEVFTRELTMPALTDSGGAPTVPDADIPASGSKDPEGTPSDDPSAPDSSSGTDPTPEPSPDTLP